MEQTRALVELQEHDLALVRLNKQLDEMPEKRAILAARGKLAELRTLHKRVDRLVGDSDALVSKGEDEIRTLTERVQSEQAKLLSGEIKNPKELQAISMELDSLKRRIAALEGDTLVKMEKREAAKEQSDKIHAAIEAGEATEARMSERFKTNGGALLTAIDAEQKARAALMRALPETLRARYEEKREAGRGIAVGVLRDDGVCSACRVGLPAGKVDALTRGPDVGVCPNCGRLLVVRGI